MTISYTLVPMPRWYFADNSGRPLGGGYMRTFENINPQVEKPIFSSSSGDPTTQWPNPVFFDANGEAPGPFFWSFNDAATTDDSYYIEVYDSSNNKLFTMRGYGPGVAGGGGGGSTTVNNFLENYVVNNVFLDNGGTFNSITSGTVIAPSDHHGLVKAAPTDPGVKAKVPFSGPDIMFVRSNDTAPINDNLTVASFNLGDNFFGVQDVTPEFYVDLACTNVGAGNTLKCVQFPIDLHVKNLEQTKISCLLWANGISGTQTIAANFVQYFGTGSATVPVVTPFFGATTVPTGTWTPFSGTITSTPSVAGKVLGNGGDDATYLQIVFPASATFEIQFTKPKIYLGQITSVFPELQTYDYVDRIINSPRTGDYRISMNSHAPFGWVAANDGSIGKGGSGASNRANADTWPLYALLYTSVLDHWAPLSVGTRTGTTVADAYTAFNAGTTLTLTRALGRVIASANGLTITSQNFTKTDYVTGPEHFTLTVASSALYPTGTPVQLTTSGGGALPAALAINTIYYVINTGATTIKLATTLDNAYAGTALDVGGNATPTCTVQTSLGAYFGESAHLQLESEVGNHFHPALGTFVSTDAANNIYNDAGATGGTTHTATAGNQSGTADKMNIIQPSVYANVFLKL